MDQLSVITMNVWGLPEFLSKEKTKRLNAIADYLNSNDYDFVCLQELWCQVDFDRIKNKCKVSLPYAQYFHSGVFGSGLAIYTKWPILKTYYNQWSLNGYVHKLHHGDWFGGKGVALAQIAYKDIIVNLYNAHLIAKYSDNDCYLVHRIVQAFNTGLFVDLTSPAADLSIFCGDLNSTPKDLAFKLIKAVGHLQDAFDARDRNNRNVTGTFAVSSNSFSGRGGGDARGVRLDYILYRTDRNYLAKAVSYNLPMNFSVPGEMFSYSDHEAVEAVFKLRRLNHLCDVNFPKLECDTNLIKYALQRCFHGEKELAKYWYQYICIAIVLTVTLLALEYCHPHLTFCVNLFMIPVILYFIFLATIWYKQETNAITGAKQQMQFIIHLHKHLIAYYESVYNERNNVEENSEREENRERNIISNQSMRSLITPSTSKVNVMKSNDQDSSDSDESDKKNL